MKLFSINLIFRSEERGPRFLDSRSGGLKAETKNGVTVPRVFKEAIEAQQNQSLRKFSNNKLATASGVRKELPGIKRPILLLSLGKESERGIKPGRQASEGVKILSRNGYKFSRVQTGPIFLC